MKPTLLLITLCLFSIVANATVIYMDSNAVSTTNSTGEGTVDLAGTLHPNPSWGTALTGSDWISYGSTGDPGDPGYFNPSDGIVVTFSTTFILSGSITAATLEVMADDSTSVILNGHTLITVTSWKGSRCTNTVIGCLASTEGVFAFSSLSPYLVDGTNTLSFAVLKMNSASFGLDFAGSVTDNTATPEPATLAFIGSGLVILAAMRRKK